MSNRLPLVSAGANCSRLDACYFELLRDPDLWQLPLDQTHRHIILTTCNAMNASRVGVWAYSADRQRLVLQHRYDAQTDAFSDDDELLARAYPSYFELLATSHAIDVTDMTTDSRMREFQPAYTRSSGLRTRLDITLHHGGNIWGVLSIEHQGTPRIWREGEKHFAALIATLLSQINVELAFRTLQTLRRRMADQLPMGMLRLDDDGHYVYANAQWRTLFQCDTVPARRDWLALFPANSRADIQSGIARVLANRERFNITICLRKPTGPQWIWCQWAPITGEEIFPGTVLGIFSDVTREHESQERLQDVTALNQAILDNAGLSIITTDLNGAITSFNRAAETMLGYKADEMIGRIGAEVFHDPEEITRSAESLRDELQADIQPGFEVFTARPQRQLREQHEWTYIRSDGSRLPVALTISALQRDSGEIDGYLGIAMDLSERNAALEQLRHNEMRYRTLFEHSGDGIFIMQGQRIIDCNPAASRIFGYPREELISFQPPNISTPIQPDRRQSTVATEGYINAAMNGERPFFEWQYCRRNGEPFMAEVTLTRMMLGTEPHLVGSVRDITEQRRTSQVLKENEARYGALFKYSPDGICVLRDDILIDCNESFLRMFGGTRDEILGQHKDKFSPPRQPDGRTPYQGKMDILEATREESCALHYWVHKRLDGSTFDSEVTLTHVTLSGEELLLATVRDITARKQAESELLRSYRSIRWKNQVSVQMHNLHETEEIARAAVNLLADICNSHLISFYYLNTSTQMSRLIAEGGPNRGKFFRIRDYQYFAVVQQLLVDHSIIISDIAHTDMLSGAQKAFLGERNTHTLQVLPAYSRQQLLGVIALEFDQEPSSAIGEEDLLAFASTIATSLSNAFLVAELRHQAETDALTQLPNRTVMLRELDICVSAEMPVALLLLDLNHFKDINDTLGHHVGDELLCAVTGRLRTRSEQSQALLCRLGGDEFAVLLRDATLKQGEQLARDLLTALQQPFVVEGMHLEIGASIGVAQFPEHGSNANQLLRAADVAMYSAKSSGAGVHCYARTRDINSAERLRLMTDLNRAVGGGELILHYQPKVDLHHRGHVIGYEALVRWQHPLSGLLTPAAFMPFAEVSETIHSLTMEVLRQALMQQKYWRNQRMPAHIAVNLSTRNLLHSGFYDDLVRLLRECDAEPSLLELEITETSLMQDPASSAALLVRIAALGIHIAIDDFGTGYSSLAYLRKLPLHALKIDRAFVQELARNDQDQVIVRSIVALAHNLNLDVIAEGVEDAETLTLLRAMGCDAAQGYYVSRPQPAADIEYWLAHIS